MRRPFVHVRRSRGARASFEWVDRLARVRAFGLNSITTYVPWNFHESQPGVFDFHSEWRDLVRFLKLAQRAGLLVLLRPGRPEQVAT